ncbi:MAG: hypothetical protein MJK14_22385 [Rivularia sp. ALOHA_DT_140]|nr:hypothetical protein [Rivularia sp. ALOHA_DT_140]
MSDNLTETINHEKLSLDFQLDAGIPQHIDINIQKIEDLAVKELAISILKRYLFHRYSAQKAHRSYENLSKTLNIMIPVLSAILTAIADFGLKYFWLLGLSLTIITILNSLLKPTEKFTSFAQVRIRLQEWEVDFSIQLSAIIKNKSNLDDGYNIDKFLEDKNKQLSGIVNNMAENWLPKSEISV